MHAPSKKRAPSQTLYCTSSECTLVYVSTVHFGHPGRPHMERGLSDDQYAHFWQNAHFPALSHALSK